MVVEARIDPHQLREAADEEAGADEQHDRERDLGDDERAAQELAAGACRRRAAAVLQRAREIRPRRVERGDDAEEDAGQDGGGRRRAEDAQVDADVRDPRQSRGEPRDDPAHAEIREPDADRGARHREHEPFDEQAAHEPPAARAEGRTNPHLPAADGGAREHQVRHVRARDEQHERDRAEQHQHPQLDPPDEVLAQRDHADAPARAPLGVLRVERLGHTVHLLRGLLDRHTGLETRDRDEVVVPVAAAHLVLVAEPDRHVDFRRLVAADRIREAARHDADDLPALLAEVDRPADDVRRAAEAALPEAVAQDGDVMLAEDLVRWR